MTGEKLNKILNDLRDRLTCLLGDRLEAVYLYGSQARGDARPDSDIDVMIVLRGDFNYFDKILKVSHCTAELLAYDTVISCVFCSKTDYEHDQTPLLLNIRREAVLV